MEFPVYLDHHSTTPCLPEVIEAMIPYFDRIFGNPAAITHAHGRKAATALEDARAAVADFVGARPTEIAFTAGATESNNLLFQGLGLGRGDHVISSRMEHKSVIRPLELLEKRGVALTWLEPDEEGFLDPESLREALRPESRLVSIMAANGEIGTIEPIAELAAVCRERGVPLHSDATQAVGKIALDLRSTPIDFLSFSAHKFYGPKGIGGLFIRRGRRLEPVVTGGGQERNVRSGTVNVPGAVGMAAALDIRRREMAAEAERLARLRDRLRERLEVEVERVTVHGPTGLRLPGNLNVGFEGIEAEALMLALRNFSISSGSACSSGDQEPSHVLLAMGVAPDRAMESIRIGMGRSTTDEEVDRFVMDLRQVVPRLREQTV